MPQDETKEPGVLDEGQDEVSFERPEQTATSDEEKSDYQRATVVEETSTDDMKDGNESEGEPEEKPREESKDESKEKPKDDVPYGVRKRINKITRQKYEEQERSKKLAEENAELKRQLAEISAGKELAEIEGKKPERDKFEDDADYYASLSDWAARRAMAEERSKSVPRQTETGVPTDYKVTKQETDTILNMGRQAYNDYDQVVFNAKYMPDAVIKEALKTDIPHEIIYEIAQDESLGAKIMDLNRMGVANEIKRIETMLSAGQKPKQTKSISNAPKPIKPQAGNQSIQEKSLEELSHEEYRKRRGFSMDGMQRAS